MTHPNDHKKKRNEKPKRKQKKITGLFVDNQKNVTRETETSRTKSQQASNGTWEYLLVH